MGLKLSTSGGGAVHLQPASSIATDVTLTVPVTGGEIPLKDGSGNISTAGTITATSFVGSGASLTGIAGGFSNMQVFTSSGTFDAAALNVTKARITVVGGGGGGGNNQAGQVAGGGGAAVAIISGLSSSYSITVGAGGAASNTGNGSAGGTSSFGSLISATGGGGGTSGSTAIPNCGAGTITSGTEIFRSSTSADSGYFGGYLSKLTFGNAFRPPTASATSNIAYSTSGFYCAGGAGSGESTSTNNTASGGINGVVIVEY